MNAPIAPPAKTAPPPAAACHIALENVSVSIPVFTPGQQRLLQRPSFLTSVGGRLSKSNGRVHVEALKNVSFEINHGQALALIGHNGAGKTTLLRVIAGIYPPTQGVVRVEGRIGCVFDAATGISPDMTGRECIKYHTLIYGRGANWREIEQDVTAFTDFGDFLDLPVRTYSSGMNSRLTAALATAWKHDILLIDEGIGAGDAAFQKKFSTRLENYLRSAGMLVLASHSTEMLRSYCTHGLVVAHGSVRFFGGIEGALAFYADSLKRQQ